MSTLNFPTRIDGEKFFNLLTVLDGCPERTSDGFEVYSGDYWDAVENLKVFTSDARSAMREEWQKEIEQAIADMGKPVDVLQNWLEAVYLIHERTNAPMKFTIN